MTSQEHTPPIPGVSQPFMPLIQGAAALSREDIAANYQGINHDPEGADPGRDPQHSKPLL